MKYSIILPIYNVEKYLSPCIESILAQTCKDYEIILVDDGSKDSSGKICDEYAAANDCIKVIHQTNSGQAVARNVGLEAAKGEYICYIDSDDYLIDDTVLQQLAEKTVGDPDIVHYKFVEWFESDGHIASCKFDYKVPTDGRTLADIYCDLIDKDAYYNSAWSKIIKRSLLMDNNIRFEPGIISEDNEWYYHVVLAAKTLVLVDKPYYVYRRRKGSTTTSSNEKHLRDQIHILEKWEELLKEKKSEAGAKVILGSLAKQYCSALIIYAGLSNVGQYFEKVKSKSYLLKYSNNKRVVIFRRMKKLIGIRGIIVALRIANKIR